jgi:hypothetical protein
MHLRLLGPLAACLLAPLAAASNDQVLSPQVTFSVHDEPVDGLGDSFNSLTGLIRTQSSRADRAMQEFDVSAFVGQSIASATLSGRVVVNNASDNGVRTFDFTLYEGNGVADLADYQAPGAVVGSGQYQPPADTSFDYSFDCTAAVQALLDAGATHVGLRAEGTSNPNFPNILSDADGRLVIKLGAPPSTSPFCFGDGAGSACPCGNSGAAGSGCANSAGAGARLGSTGTPSVAAASGFQLSGTGLVPGTTGLYFEGTTALAGNLLGDGLRCAGGAVRRLQVRPSSLAGSSSSTLDIPAASGVAAGETRYYQLWYRDPISGPCGSGFNLSNGLAVTWQP